MKKKLIAFAAVALCSIFAVVTLGYASFSGVSNGSFEAGGAPGTVAAIDSSTITGWTVTSGDVDYVDYTAPGGIWQAADGVRSIDLNGFGAGSITQDVATSIGLKYVVTFYLSGNPGDCQHYPNGNCSPSDKTMTVSATGAAAQAYDFDTAAALNTFDDMKWIAHTYSFVATSATTRLSFASTTVGAFGPALDNVVVTQATPATADDCKKGGWMTLVDAAGNKFKNQGDCVSYVATHGRNVAAGGPP